MKKASLEKRFITLDEMLKKHWNSLSFWGKVQWVWWDMVLFLKNKAISFWEQEIIRKWVL
jgi:hypothetical protein